MKEKIALLNPTEMQITKLNIFFFINLYERKHTPKGRILHQISTQIPVYPKQLCKIPEEIFF